MRKFFLLLVVSVLGGSGCLGQPTGPTALRGSRAILFVGNSLTSANGLPAMLQDIARLAGDTTVAVAMVAYPDYALSDHFTQGTTRDWFRRRQLAFVVLQQGSSALPESQAHLKAWTTAYAPLIRETGAEPVLFMVWPTASRLFDFPNVRQSYRNAAVAAEGIFAPAGDAWVAYARERSGLAEPGPAAFAELYTDGLHPSALGSYLAAIVLLERMTGIAPGSLPPVVPGVPVREEQVRALQRAATVALANNPPFPHREP